MTSGDVFLSGITVRILRKDLMQHWTRRARGDIVAPGFCESDVYASPALSFMRQAFQGRRGRL